MRIPAMLLVCLVALAASEPATVRIQAGHAGTVTHVAVSADGRGIASAGSDGRVLAWDPQSWMETGLIGRLASRPTALCWAGAVLVAADESPVVHAWPGDRSVTMGGMVVDLAGWPDGLVAIATADGIAWWRPGAGGQPVIAAMPCAPVARLVRTGDGGLLVLGKHGLLAIDAGGTVPRWVRADLGGTAVAASADGRSIYIAGPTGLQRLDMINAKARLTVPGVPAAAGRLQPGAVQALPRPRGFGAIQDLQVDGRGRLIYTQSVHTGLWMVADAALVELPIAGCWPGRMAQLDGSRFVAASASGRPQVIELGPTAATLGGPIDMPLNSADGLWTSPDGRWLATPCFRGEVRLWDLHAARLHQRVRLDRWAGHVFLDQTRRKDGRLAVAAVIEDPSQSDATSGLTMLDPRDGSLTPMQRLPAELGAPIAVASAPDGSVVLLTTDYRSRFLSVRVAVDGAVGSTAISGFGAMQLDAWRPGLDPAAGVVAAGGDGWVGLWDLGSGAARWSRTGAEAPHGASLAWFIAAAEGAVWASGAAEFGRWSVGAPAERTAVDTVASRQGEWNDYSPLLVDGAARWQGQADGSIRRWRDGVAQPALSGAHSLSVNAMQLLPDGTLASAGADGAVVLWLPGGGWVTLLADAGEWIVAADDGTFDGSPGCGRLVAMSVGQRAAGIDQFAAAKNRPDLILDRLGHADSGYRAILLAANQRRLARLGSAAEVSWDGLPEVRISAAEVHGAEASLTAELTATRGLARWQLWLDGVPQIPEAAQAVGGPQAKLQHRLVLPSGRHRVEASCFDGIGRESLRAAIALDSAVAPVRPDLHVLAIGVSKYRSAGLDLGWAHQDAIDLAAALSHAGGGMFGAVHATVVTDAQATTAGIRTAGAALAASRPGDTVVVLVAGHGQHDTDGTYCLLTHDCNPADLAHTALPFGEIEAMISAAPALRRLVLLDACESGERDETVAATPAGRTTTGGKSRGLRPVSSAPKGLRREERFIFNDLRRRTGAVVLSSSTGDQLSYERDELANGLFTQAILECLAGAGDADHDGGITQHELRDFVTRRVSEQTANLQTPVIDRDNLQADIRLPVLSGLTP